MAGFIRLNSGSVGDNRHSLLAANQNGDRFDEENLTRAFQWACEHCDSCQEILDYLFEQVQLFIGSTNRNGDDMTLVVMQVKSSE